MQIPAPIPAGGLRQQATRFDASQLERQDLISRLVTWLSQYPQGLLSALRWLFPVACFGRGRRIVLRHDLVRQVLADSRRFPVPWGWKMKLVTCDEPQSHLADPKHPGCAGRNFVLGMASADDEYRSDYQLLAKAFAYPDTSQLVPHLAREATEHFLSKMAPTQGRDTFDLVEQLVLTVPTRMCCTYYGVAFGDEPVQVGKCMLAVSSFLFGADFDPPRGGADDEKLSLALQAAPTLRHFIRATIQVERAAAAASPESRPTNPLQRLLREAGSGADNRVHVQLFGMMMGFVPTNVLAGGNILETLLRQPEQMAAAVAAADAGDDERLWRCLRETLRFRNINLGPLRRCVEDTVLVDASGRRAQFRAGQVVLASTQLAMFDSRVVNDPHRYSIARPEEDYLIFGAGQHWCIGAYIAIVQLTQMFKLLLRRYRLEPVPGRLGRMQRWQVFPLHQHVRLLPRGQP